ncbi:hypothetical protein LOTGIDRAFT_234565 [Lottia gigantea]|uniref:SRCR domain-containing protein n=1 Tax=Lottia gigantea TaxID=225164 RepID=V4A0R5_LOTGI|nr:hypothetical protein LOTGIDRAFT_234565 [Lottia gigantea]ESO88515.1 hypothetical protein LOTGIDRAFT_234565 [Lottia gigantea]
MNLRPHIILLCLWSGTVIASPTQSGYKLRLESGKENYGFVKMSQSGLIRDAYYSVCPSRNQKYTDLLGRIICLELGYLDGESFDMKAESSSFQFWHTKFDVFTDYEQKTVMPNITAYGNRNWTFVDAIGDFSYCKSSAIAVFCHGEVSVNRIDSDLSFILHKFKQNRYRSKFYFTVSLNRIDSDLSFILHKFKQNRYRLKFYLTVRLYRIDSDLSFILQLIYTE